MKKLISVLFSLTFIFSSVYAQNIQIKGKVISNAFNEPLPGVNVTLKDNPSVGAITDLDGQFSMSVSKNAVLSVSYIGFKSVLVPVKGQTELQIILHEDTVFS